VLILKEVIEKPKDYELPPAGIRSKLGIIIIYLNYIFLISK
jgi:hypothetical protein